MNDGHDMHGRDLDGGTDFFMGAAMFPEAEPWPLQRARAEQKVEAGARFFQTQAIFDIDKLARATEAMHARGREGHRRHPRAAQRAHDRLHQRAARGAHGPR